MQSIDFRGIFDIEVAKAAPVYEHLIQMPMVYVIAFQIPAYNVLEKVFVN